MKRNTTILFLLVLAAFGSCKKAPVMPDHSQLEQEAYQVLSGKMAPADFSMLDWQQVKAENVKGKPGLLKIKHRYESHKTLLFGRIDGVNYTNWVEVEIVGREGANIYGTVILSDLKNHVLNQIKVGLQPERLGQPADVVAARSNDDPGDLPPFTVIGYTNNDPSPWWSLYWLFNSNMQWFSQYTQSDFLDPSCTTCFGGDDVLSLDDLYPETPEILLFEHDYLGTMTQEEAQIYHSMSRSNQLKYLWNASRALTASQMGFQAPYHNGKADAFRHAYFNALNSRALDIELATALANAHENSPNNPPLEREMDLRNNQVGRNVYLFVLSLNLTSHFFDAGLQIKINEMMQNGELWYLSPLQPNGQIIPGVTQLIPTNQ